MFACRYYRVYDIGKEIDLDRLEHTLSEEHATGYSFGRAGFQGVQPKSIMLEDPPLTISLDWFLTTRDSVEYQFSVVAKVYDIGAISICFIHADQHSPATALEDTALRFFGQEGLSPLFEYYLGILESLLRPHLKDMASAPDSFEDYTIYVMDKIDRTIDPVVLMTGERHSVSQQMRDEITKNTLSYRSDDLAILSYDSSLICEPESPADMIDLIEFANVQVLELKYYDRELTRQMEKMYDDIDLADRLPGFWRSRQYHAIMAGQMRTYAEISEIFEKVNNLIKVTEDVYYARVYATALKVLRSDQWSSSVNRKIEVIHENYTMLSDEVRIQHSNFLEWIVIILIALEFGVAIWRSLV
jgi:hypothetical protein